MSERERVSEDKTEWEGESHMHAHTHNLHIIIVTIPELSTFSRSSRRAVNTSRHERHVLGASSVRGERDREGREIE